jgi:type II secretory pathway pseudopilin PulG
MKINIRDTGDTLIEVLLSATALALVLSVSFVSANRSLRTGTEAASRNEAVQYASQQIEFVRLGINDGTLITAGAGKNIPAGNFCMDQTSHRATPLASNGSCPVDTAGNFGVVDSFDGAKQTFTITTQWQSSLSSTTNQVVMYYQDPQ